MAKIYLDHEADLSFVKDKTIAILGYGNQGRSQALNLRDSGLNVIVGNRDDESRQLAVDDGFEAYTVEEAAARADIIFFLVPDESMPEVYEKWVEPNLEEGNMLSFASGYNIFYNFISPPDYIDVVLLAPRMIGQGVRDTYVKGTGFPSLIAVHQDASGEARQRLLALAKGIGSTRMGAVESSFEEETVLDIFSEHQGRLYLIRLAYEVLVEAGFSPEAVILELYGSGESMAIAEAIVKHGLWGQQPLHSRTSQYGQEVVAKRYLDEDKTKETYNNIINYIRNGGFAKEWYLEQQAGFPVFKRVREQNNHHPLVQAESELYKLLGRR